MQPYQLLELLKNQHQKHFKSLQANIDEATESNSGLIKLGQLAKVKQNGKWGLVGTNGQVLLDPQYKELDPSYAEDGTYFVKLKKTLDILKQMVPFIKW